MKFGGLRISTNIFLVAMFLVVSHFLFVVSVLPLNLNLKMPGKGSLRGRKFSPHYKITIARVCAFRARACDTLI